MEAPGVEPGSEDALERASTCVADSLVFVAPGGCRRPTGATSQPFVSPLGRLTLPRGQPDCRRCFLRSRRKPRSTVAGLSRRPWQMRYRSQLLGCPFLRGHGRHDTQLEPHHPRRNRFAPLSKNRWRNRDAAGATINMVCTSVDVKGQEPPQRYRGDFENARSRTPQAANPAGHERVGGWAIGTTKSLQSLARHQNRARVPGAARMAPVPMHQYVIENTKTPVPA